MTSRVPEGISHQITCKISSSSPGQGQRCALDMTLKTKSVKYRTQILQEHRKSSKPIMEKRRRARINESLAQLKTLILDALNKDTSRHSKLEKADILEITVKHLKNLQQTASSFSTLEYRAGFSQCINEVLCFLSTHDGMDTEVKPLLLSHLRRCVPHLDFIPGQPQHHPRGRAVKPGLEPPAASPLHSPHLLSPSEASKTRSGFHLVPSNSGTLGVLIPGSSSVCLADHLHIAPLSGAFPNAQVNAQGFLWRPW